MAPMKSVLSCGRPYTPTHYDFVLVRGAPVYYTIRGQRFYRRVYTLCRRYYALYGTNSLLTSVPVARLWFEVLCEYGGETV